MGFSLQCTSAARCQTPRPLFWSCKCEQRRGTECTVQKPIIRAFPYVLSYVHIVCRVHPCAPSSTLFEGMVPRADDRMHKRSQQLLFPVWACALVCMEMLSRGGQECSIVVCRKGLGGGGGWHFFAAIIHAAVAYSKLIYIRGFLEAACYTVRAWANCIGLTLYLLKIKIIQFSYHKPK
jgi:hypothetical protein